ncbi:ABC transporter substrate-binding protein [Aquamicrobium sp. LC103]|uniref:ABC transporter substrate-binding protein n=1 Tax=Aquamicrobium sp. LC103 TaxID=1120658 RepID=UPI00063E9867|nr:ABC transporter substrate-binding protein [Aquamicrobium sp. LC103]TKT78167.1 ABC transporter substrate-binding protein [Aquamicrobium sp. LC103]
MTSGFLGRTLLVAGAFAIASSQAIAQQVADEVSIVVFGPPSLGAFLPPIIKAQGLDTKHGLDITFVERTPDAYTAQFNSGEFQVGGSAALLTVGLAEARGVKATYLFNLFDFWGAVVTSNDEVQTLADLQGKDLAAAAGTTNYVMFNWFARQQGIDTSNVSIVNTATPGLVGYAMANRAAAVQLWEPAYTSLLAQRPETRTLDLKIQDAWSEFAGSTNIPYLGVAAHASWVEENEALVPRLYAAYKDAADWVSANPEEAAEVIGAKGTPEVRKNYADLIRNNDRLGLNVQWAGDVATEIRKVYEAGTSIDYLPSMPTDATIYSGSEKP